MGQQEVKVVLNASVFLAAMLLDEPKEVSDGAMRMVLDIDSGKVIAHVPDRFEDEVLGGLVEAISKGRPVSATVFAIFLHFWEKFRVHSRNTDWHAEEVFQAALRWRVSYYDALYLVLAQKVGATYWTADRKLLRFLRQHRFSDLPDLAWIGDYRR